MLGAATHSRCQTRTVWRARAVPGRCPSGDRAVCGQYAGGAHLFIGQVARNEYRHGRVVATRYRPLDAPVAQAADSVVQDDDGEECVDDADEQQCGAEEVDSDVRRRG